MNPHRRIPPVWVLALPTLAFGIDVGFIIVTLPQILAAQGRGRSWIRTRYPLVTGEADPPVAGFLKLVDTANGLVVRERPGSVFFANVDLTVHFLRQPEAGWVGFDTRVNFGPTGLGETLSVLSDIHGPVGSAAQSLTVRVGENWPGGPR